VFLLVNFHFSYYILNFERRIYSAWRTDAWIMHLYRPLTMYNKRITRDQYSGIYTLCTFTIHFRGRSRFRVAFFMTCYLYQQIPRIWSLSHIRGLPNETIEELSDVVDKTKENSEFERERERERERKKEKKKKLHLEQYT